MSTSPNSTTCPWLCLAECTYDISLQECELAEFLPFLYFVSLKELFRVHSIPAILWLQINYTNKQCFSVSSASIHPSGVSVINILGQAVFFLTFLIHGLCASAIQLIYKQHHSCQSSCWDVRKMSLLRFAPGIIRVNQISQVADLLLSERAVCMVGSLHPASPWDLPVTANLLLFQHSAFQSLKDGNK